MISKEALQDQKFLSLRDRVKLLWQQHFIHISTYGLRSLYKRHGITHRKARSMKKSFIRDHEEYDRKRSDFAWQILSLVRNYEPVVYVDETSISINNLKVKTWQRPDSAIYAPKNDTNFESIPIYAALTTPNVLRQSLVMIGTGTEGD